MATVAGAYGRATGTMPTNQLPAEEPLVLGGVEQGREVVVDDLVGCRLVVEPDAGHEPAAVGVLVVEGHAVGLLEEGEGIAQVLRLDAGGVGDVFERLPAGAATSARERSLPCPPRHLGVLP